MAFVLFDRSCDFLCRPPPDFQGNVLEGPCNVYLVLKSDIIKVGLTQTCKKLAPPPILEHEVGARRLAFGGPIN